MVLTFQDGINDTLFALAVPSERCHIDGRIDDNADRLCRVSKADGSQVHDLQCDADQSWRFCPMRSTSMVIRPGTDELLIFTNDWDKGQGSTIFAARALAKAATQNNGAP